jgi:hypothetical protein
VYAIDELLATSSLVFDSNFFFSLPDAKYKVHPLALTRPRVSIATITTLGVFAQVWLHLARAESSLFASGHGY